MGKSNETRFKALEAQIEAQTFLNMRLFEWMLIIDPLRFDRMAKNIRSDLLELRTSGDDQDRLLASHLGLQMKLIDRALLARDSVLSMREALKKAQKDPPETDPGA